LSRPSSLTRGSLTRAPRPRKPRERLGRHLALTLVREQPGRFLERQPANLGHLLRVLGRDVPEPARAVAEEEEAHHLENPFSGPGVDVAYIAELLDGSRLDARLLRYLAQGGQLGPLARPDQALRQRPGSLGLPGRADRGQHRPAPQLTDDHAARRE